MREDLRVTHYNDGAQIAQITDPNEWISADENGTPARDNE